MTNDFFLRMYISFDDWKYIPREKFEWIEEWHGGQDRSYLVGVIHFQKLIGDKWWKQHGVSLILTPEPVIESVEIRNLKKRSLELASPTTRPNDSRQLRTPFGTCRDAYRRTEISREPRCSAPPARRRASPETPPRRSPPADGGGLPAPASCGRPPARW